MKSLKDILLEKKPCKSIWFMRQAGRYLPEFRRLRSKNKNFIKLCLNSKLSSKITLQPIERFDLDSAIIFSDILIVPYALGQNIEFVENRGPKLSSFNFQNFLKNKDKIFLKTLNPVYEAIQITRKKLNKKKSLISFVGAPWTLLVYMLDLKSDVYHLDLNKLKKNERKIPQIIDLLIKYLCLHIEKQVDSGADLVQIFDSWAGMIPQEKLQQYCYQPNAQIVEFCRRKKIPSICFPKGIKNNYETFNDFVKPDGINLDPEIEPLWAREKLKKVVIQGGLDPKILLQTDKEIMLAATKYMNAFKGIPYVFNLGHGLLPETDPDKVNNLINFYRKFNGSKSS